MAGAQHRRLLLSVGHAADPLALLPKAAGEPDSGRGGGDAGPRLADPSRSALPAAFSHPGGDVARLSARPGAKQPGTGRPGHGVGLVAGPGPRQREALARRRRPASDATAGQPAVGGAANPAAPSWGIGLRGAGRPGGLRGRRPGLRSAFPRHDHLGAPGAVPTAQAQRRPTGPQAPRAAPGIRRGGTGDGRRPDRSGSNPDPRGGRPRQ